MHLKSITLRQFRSYHELHLPVDPGVNLFLGLNGSGKTNFIESIAVLATGSSPRGSEADSLVEWGRDGFYIGGWFGFDEENAEPVKLDMKYQPGSSRVIRKNEKTAVRLRDLAGFIPIVSFVPEDLALVKGEPAMRRRAINMILMQVDPAYAQAVRRYAETVRSRNAALRQLAEGRIGADALTPWDDGLIETGLTLCRKRAAFLEEFSERAGRVHHRVSGGRERLDLKYEPSFPGPWDDEAEKRWRDKLQNARAQELAVGATLTGPHRDDFVFLLDGRPARVFGSEGQKRTGAVSFKLAEIPYVQERKNECAICLLDDVLSELDLHRAALLLDELSRTSQCFVTLTGLESWPRDHDLPAAVYTVSESRIERDETLGRAHLPTMPEAVTVAR